MKAYKQIGLFLHQSHCSIVPKNTALLFPKLLQFIFPKSLHFFFLFTKALSFRSTTRIGQNEIPDVEQFAEADRSRGGLAPPLPTILKSTK